MPKYPPKLTIGPQDQQTIYELVPDQVLIKVKENTDEKDLSAFLNASSFESAVPEHVERTRHTLEPAGFRWVTNIPSDDVGFENAQVALEQDYWRLRQVETRYRRLFDMVGDGVLVLDAA